MILWSGVFDGAPIKARAGRGVGLSTYPVGYLSPRLGCRNGPARSGIAYSAD